jgi:hypothetical protein
MEATDGRVGKSNKEGTDLFDFSTSTSQKMCPVSWQSLFQSTSENMGQQKVFWRTKMQLLK